MGQYVNNLEIMFAARVMYNWNDHTRELRVGNRFTRPERIMLDVVIERTEQDLFNDRYAGQWIQKWALAEAMEQLAQIRGMMSNWPGAGGGISLNASDLKATADDMKEKLLAEIDDYVVDHLDEIGMAGGGVVFG